MGTSLYDGNDIIRGIVSAISQWIEWTGNTLQKGSLVNIS